MHLHAHLIMRGFKNNYKIWNKHGEQGINPGEPPEGFVCGIGDEGPSSTNNGRREHVDGTEAQPSDDEILWMDDDYVDLV